MREDSAFCWSGGKDSALALYKMLRDDRYRVVSLVTTCNDTFGRVSMHGVRLELARAQARAIGLPLEVVSVREGSSNEEYEREMSACLLAQKQRGVTRVGFGDIFLADLRQWREQNLARIGLTGVFPLWKIDTRKIVGEFIELGFRSIVCCVSDAYLDETVLGRSIGWEFVDALPHGVDPCGERGEFHTFAYAGPIFKRTIDVSVGEKVHRNGFWYCDLVPA